MRRAAKVDGNHRVIVAAFRALGCSVESLAAVGKGVPDLLVGFAGLNHLVEIKDGAKAKSQRKLTPAQVVWASTWRAPRHLVESVDDVQRLVGAWRKAEADRQFVVDLPTEVRALPTLKPDRTIEELCAALDACGARLRVSPAQKWPLATMKPPLAVAPDFDASDYERPAKPNVRGGR